MAAYSFPSCFFQYDEEGHINFLATRLLLISQFLRSAKPVESKPPEW